MTTDQLVPTEAQTKAALLNELTRTRDRRIREAQASITEAEALEQRARDCRIAAVHHEALATAYDTTITRLDTPPPATAGPPTPVTDPTPTEQTTPPPEPDPTPDLEQLLPRIPPYYPVPVGALMCWPHDEVLVYFDGQWHRKPLMMSEPWP